MIYYIWVINMASRYQFSDEEIKAIEQARRENKDKRAEARLKALELRAKGAGSKDVAEATGFCSAYVSQLVAKYRSNGLEAISGNHYGGNHRNSGSFQSTRGKGRAGRNQRNRESISKCSRPSSQQWSNILCSASSWMA